MHGGMHGGMHGEMQGKYYRYCSRSIRYSTDLNSENNKFDLETFDLVSEYCTFGTIDMISCSAFTISNGTLFTLKGRHTYPWQ